MIIEQLKSEFLPKEIILKLHRDMEVSDYKSRIKLVEVYAKSISDSFDNDVFEVKLNNELGFLYWQGEQFHSAIRHYEKVVKILKAEHYPWIYFHTIGMLCRCNRLIKNYQKSLEWIVLAFEQNDMIDGNFDRLYLLTEYADLILDSNISFNSDYLPLISEVIDKLEFKISSPDDPVKSIQLLKQTNLKWNRELSRITLLPRDNKKAILKEFEKYYKSCEIGWYRNYANDRIAELKKVGNKN
jgi:hypothetical protein